MINAIVKIQSRPFILLFLTIFCLVGLETQTVLPHISPSNHPLIKGEIGGLPFPSQGHACGCNDTDVWRRCNDTDDWRNCCCCSEMPLSDAPLQTGIAYIVNTLRCWGIHTDMLVSHLTQYEPLINKIEYIWADSGTLLPQSAKKPLEPCLSPPYKPPEHLPDTHTL
jgi:hypothetical protein